MANRISLNGTDCEDPDDMPSDVRAAMIER